MQELSWKNGVGQICLGVALLLSLSAVAVAQPQIAIGEYPIPTIGSSPFGITTGPDGALWFTEAGGNKIGRMTTAGAVTEYPVPTAGSSPNGITTGPDGALWFTEFSFLGNKIGRITTAGAITEYPVPTASGDPVGIAAGPDGALWFTEYYGHKIGRITTAGIITEYALPRTREPYGITAGPDGALWFTEEVANKIGRITTTGVITEYALPTGNSAPSGITAGPDGALWFTEINASKIGRITTAGAITEYPVPGTSTFPAAITTGPDGALWFGELFAIGRITTAGAITVYNLPGGNGPSGITTGPDGALWFTDYTGKIGQAVFVTASLIVGPASGSYQTNLTFTGSMFAPNESVKIYANGDSGILLASARADSSGSFTAAARAPQSVYGPRIFIGIGQTSGKVGAASFSVKARLILNPNSGAAGSVATARGYGFGPGELVRLSWEDPFTHLWTATTDIHGSFTRSATAPFTVPISAPAGVNTVVGAGQTTGVIGGATFTVQ